MQHRFTLTDAQADEFDALPRQAGAAIRFWRTHNPDLLAGTDRTVFAVERENRHTFRVYTLLRKLTREQIRAGRFTASKYPE